MPALTVDGFILKLHGKQVFKFIKKKQKTQKQECLINLKLWSKVIGLMLTAGMVNFVTGVVLNW